MNVFYNEFSDYKLFVNTFFPESILNANICFLNKSVQSLFKCIYLIELIINELDNDLDQEAVDILLDTNAMIYRMLYILPTSEKYFVSSAMRGLCESVLRTILISECLPADLNNLRNEQYRHISTKVKESNLYTHCKVSIDKVISLFGQHSKIIHNKQKNSEHITYLEEYMNGFNSYTIDTLNSNIKMITSTLLDILVISYQFDPSEFTQYNKKIYKQIFS